MDGQSEGLQDRVREEIGRVTYRTQAQGAGSLYIRPENRPETAGKARMERPALSSVQDPILCDAGPKQVDDSSSQEKRRNQIHSLLNGFCLGVSLYQNKINDIPMGTNRGLSCPRMLQRGVGGGSSGDQQEGLS